jgi:MFS transporter, NNP family, nitrate/nitrite transporter
MTSSGKATKIRLRDIHSPPMRAFHLSWMAFFLCFFGWFGIAPLMGVVREQLNLSKQQIGNTIIASVAMTIVARLAIGWLCDRFGPRRTYTTLLMVGSLPVMGIGLADRYETFLLFRLAIGVIGASFVITQHHTSLMFAANCVGTANATTAGWGNLGGGVTQIVMPLVLAALLGLGVGDYWGWRLAMVLPGLAMLAMGVLYWRLTQDGPEGDQDRAGHRRQAARAGAGAFAAAAADYRVWALFLIYAACFGVELTMNNVAALYFMDSFGLDVATAGLIAGLFGLMNIFARTLGGFAGDRAGMAWGLRGRATLLGALLLVEGFALMTFSQAGQLPAAIVTLIGFSLFVQMAEGATFSVVPFINRHAIGSVSGIVGAGGNAGAVAAGFLFRAESVTTSMALLCLGVAVSCTSIMALALRFSPEDERAAARELRLTSEAGSLRLAGS